MAFRQTAHHAQIEREKSRDCPCKGETTVASYFAQYGLSQAKRQRCLILGVTS